MRAWNGVDGDTFEADRENVLRYGISIDLSLGDLLKIKDPDVILGLRTAAEAAEPPNDRLLKISPSPSFERPLRISWTTEV